MLQTDVCILGAGPAGASAALFLAKQGIPSVLIDKSIFPRDKVCGDACSGKVSWVLRKLNDELEAEISQNKQNLPSWGVKFFGSNNNELKVPFKVNYNKLSDQAPGFISKRIDFDAQLIDLVKRESLINFIDDTAIQDFKRVGSCIELSTKKSDFKLSTKVLLAADGAYSNAAKVLMGVKIEDKRNSLGLRAYYSGVEGLDQEGFIELHFLKELLPGYFWIFPLANGGANVGLGVRADVQKKKRIKLKKAFEDIINHHPIISKRFKHARLEDEVALHGLPLGGHKNISSDNLILIGDAAALIDPFTGEGIGNAMISGMLAAEVVATNMKDKTFSKQDLKQYDELVYKRLSSELKLSQGMQDLTNYPWLFNFVVNKARKNKELQETISCMFESVDIRKKLRNPLFYLRILFG
jgi:geranylgeranyl reductase family protein